MRECVLSPYWIDPGAGKETEKDYLACIAYGGLAITAGYQ